MTDFAEQVAQWSRETQAKLRLAVRKVALEAFREVILMSPVKSGRFRGNWQVAVGQVPQGVVVLDDKTGQAVISKVEAAVMQLEVGETIYLVNNLPYARRLEYGWSQQAPEGMVRVTEARWRPIVEKVSQQLRAGMPTDAG